MKQYPSIIGIKKAPLGNNCYAFYKYDGSNLRFEWNPKQGWYKFGTKTQLVDINHPLYGEGIIYFLNNIADDLLERIKRLSGKNFKNLRSIMAYGEFLGENSFAGSHADEPKEIIIFDVWLFQKGFVEPKEFVEYISPASYGAKCLYQGPLNNSFVQLVRKNSLDVPLKEGVICKWKNPKKANNTQTNVYMAKIKTEEYLQKLKDVFSGDWEKYAE